MVFFGWFIIAVRQKTVGLQTEKVLMHFLKEIEFGVPKMDFVAYFPNY